MITRFISVRDVEALLDNIILQREVFRSKNDINFWKSAYLSIFGIQSVVEIQLKQNIWNGTSVEKPLKELRRINSRFSKIIKRNGMQKGHWNGCSPKCEEIIQKYREQCAPILISIMDTLDEESPVRSAIEHKLEPILHTD